MNGFEMKDCYLTKVWVVREITWYPDSTKSGKYKCKTEIVDIYQDRDCAIQRMKCHIDNVDRAYPCSIGYDCKWDDDRLGIKFTGPMNNEGNRHQIYVYVTEGKLIEEIEEIEEN